MTMHDDDTLARFERRFAAIEQLVPDAMPTLDSALGRARRSRRGRSVLGAAVVVMVGLTLVAVGVPLAASRLASSGLASATTPPSPASSPAAAMVAMGPGIEVPEDQLRPVDRCLVDAGFVATEMHGASTGTNERYGYTWSVPMYFTWTVPAGASAMKDATAAMSACRDRYAPYQAKTDAEIRVVYDRWVLERKCLIDLGYKPKEAPSFKDFLASWTTGPWTPVDGIGTPSLEAMDTCGLEVLR